MPFPEAERQLLLSGRGIGPAVLQRLEECGIQNLKELAPQTAQALCQRIATQLGASCWQNSPQARAAIVTAIEIACTYGKDLGHRKSR